MHRMRTLRRDLPGSFSMTDEGVARAIETDVPPESEAAATEAKNSCPVGAIEEALSSPHCVERYDHSFPVCSNRRRTRLYKFLQMDEKS